MLHDVFVDKRGLHRRFSGNKRQVFTKGVVPWLTDPALTETTTTQPPATLPVPPTTTSAPALPPTSTTAAVGPTDPTNPAPLSTTTSVAPIPTTTSTPPPTPSTTPATSATPTTSNTPTTQAPPPVKDVTTQVQVTITHTPSVTSASATSLAASPSTTTTPNSPTSSTGVVIAGIVAGIIAVAGIVFAIVYFVRRSRRSREEEDDNDFSANAFRRQSVMLPDDGASGMSRAMNYSRGGARPPTMIEQKLATAPVSWNTSPMPSHPYGYGSYNSFTPGEIVTPTTGMNSANPFFTPYSQSPVSSPVSVPAYDSVYDGRNSPAVSRQPSNASTAILSRQTSLVSKPLPDVQPDAQYVDMSRSSVTPFQAAQYAEISRRLNTTPPQPLPLGSVAEELEHPAQEVTVPPQVAVEPLDLQPSISFDEGQRLNAQPTPRENSFPESPFADPTMSMYEEQQQHVSRRDSDGSFLQAPEPSFAAKPRITSIPPTLPEIEIQQRPFSPVSLDFPASVHPTPSPFTSTFTIPSPPPNAHFSETSVPAAAAASAESVSASAPAPALAQAPLRGTFGTMPMAQRPDTVYTLYDEEDAYAGI